MRPMLNHLVIDTSALSLSNTGNITLIAGARCKIWLDKFQVSIYLHCIYYLEEERYGNPHAEMGQ